VGTGEKRRLICQKIREAEGRKNPTVKGVRIGEAVEIRGLVT